MKTLFYGKQSTPEIVRKHIVDLKLGNPSKNVAPLSVTEIAKRLGISRETVYQYLKVAKQNDEVKIKEDGKIEVNQHLQDAKDFMAFSEAHPITEDEIVKSWISACSTMGHTGKGIKSLKGHIQGIQKLCNELKIKPIQLTIDFHTSEKYAQTYYDGLLNGTIARKNLRVKSSPLGAFYQVRMAIRHLMQYNGRNSIAIPRGYNGILSGRIIGHGNYADVDMSDSEIVEAEKFILEKWGLDSDIYRVFFAGIETCARKEALLGMSLDFTEDTDDDGDTTFFMTVVEKKTEHIAEGKLDKYIQRAKTQESIRMAKRKGLVKLWDSRETGKDKAYRHLITQLKEIYKHIGKQSHYFYEEPFHTLRHVGAHYHLRQTDYNYGYVAELGGWNVIDELKKSYGKMPPQMMMRLLKKARKGLEKL
jgi:predicted transcriptional regulator